MATPAVNPASRRTGGEWLSVTLRLAALAWAVLLLQEITLYARPAPDGGPYVDHWPWYFFPATLYNLLGVMLVALPVVAVWIVCSRRLVTARVAAGLHRVLLGLLALNVALNHADNEVMRFMGTHLTVGLVRTYWRLGAWGSDMGRIFATDQGGPWLPFVILVGSPLVLWWSGSRLLRRWSRSRAWPAGAAHTAAILMLAVPLLAHRERSRFRRERVQPELLTLLQEIGAYAAEGTPPADLRGIIGRYQEGWLAGDPGSHWRFSSDSSYPLIRIPREAANPDSLSRWNVIYLQLETFRGWDVGFLRPDLRPSPTPFLDSLARTPGSAYWTRALSFGPPTLNGFIAGHCSIRPHSRVNITTSFTLTRLDCLPAALRRHGWHTAYFSATDPDWDNETLWLKRWYDERQYFPEARERDRELFRRAAHRIQSLGRSGVPFFASVVSISNHYPFVNREPAFDVTPSQVPRDAILNTMHYTDAVVGEFFRDLEGEPWFRHTLVVVLGDHGYNLGERGGRVGLHTGWRESLWIPLLIVGAHPRLPPGPHGEVASLLDVAPTLTDLLGLREPTPWQGQSLLTIPDTGRVVSFRRGRMGFVETDSFSLVLDPVSGHARLYEAQRDPLQQRDVAALHPEAVAALLRRAKEEQSLTDYLLETDRVWSRETRLLRRDG